MWKKKEYLVKDNSKPKNTINSQKKILITENENVFNNEDVTHDNSKLIIANILKSLRINKNYLLLSVFQNFNECKIKDNILEIYFTNDSYKSLLQTNENILIINNIIKNNNLKVEYFFVENTLNNNTEEILKQKFKNIKIKE